MTPPKSDADTISKEVLQVLDKLNGGVHPGFLPAHAKGILLTGTFTPSPEASSLTRAPHVQRASTPVTVRFSNFAGVPAVPDNDPASASPRGMAIRFHLAEHSHTDIVSHSADGFPVRTVEEFIQFLQAVSESGPEVAHPTPVEVFLGSHPKALAFVQIPKPIPESFATESFFSVSAYKFTNVDGASKFGRYRLRPLAGNKHLDDAVAASKGVNFLLEEIVQRIADGPVKFVVGVQVANSGDTVDDSTVQWSDEHAQVQFGTLELTSLVADDASEQKHIIFDPIPRVDGIESSADPLLDPRANVYLMSGRRRRSQ